MSLARDALASGDLVAAESYLQHAEHYNRIIMAAQTQFGAQNAHQGEGPNGGAPYRNPRWNSDEEGADEDVTEPGGGAGEVRQGGGRDIRAGGGGREDRRHGGNGREDVRDTNGSDQPEAQPSDEPAPDTTVS
jgi:hypothetical protein